MCRKSLNVLTVEVKVFLACFGHGSINIMLKMNREHLGHKNHSHLPLLGSAGAKRVLRLLWRFYVAYLSSVDRDLCCRFKATDFT